MPEPVHELVPLRRLLANGLDVLIQLQFVLASWLALELLQAGTWQLPAWLLLLAAFAACWLLAEFRQQASPGKALLGLSLELGPGRQRGFRLLLRNGIKTLMLLLTALIALELMPPPPLTQLEPKLALALRLLSALCSIAGFAILINFWILSPRMQQFWPGRCLHDWAAGSQVAASPRADYPRRLHVALLAIGLLLIGLFFSLELLLHAR